MSLSALTILLTMPSKTWTSLDLYANCAHTRSGAGRCNFVRLTKINCFKTEDDFYCIYHAPLDARRLSDEVMKKDLSDDEIKEFNNYINNYICSEETSNKIDRPLNQSIIDKLKSTFEVKELTKNEINSRWAKQLREIVDDLLPAKKNLSRVVFPGNFEINGKNIKHSLTFDECYFSGDFSISNCVFDGVFRMTSAHVGTGFFCNDSTFNKSVFFNETIFRGPVNMGDSVFNSKLDASEATFKLHAHFCCTKPGKLMSADKSFVSKLVLSEAKFKSTACFRHRVFDEIDFTSASFTDPPRFGGTRIESTAKLSAANYAGHEYEDLSEYATLRQLAATVGDRNGIEIFRAKWFECLKKDQNISTPLKTLLNLYDISSHYGTSIPKSIQSYCLFNGIMLLFYMIYFAFNAKISIFHTWLMQIIKPFSTSPEDMAGGFAELLTSIHGIGSAALLAVLLHTIYRTLSKD